MNISSNLNVKAFHKSKRIVSHRDPHTVLMNSREKRKRPQGSADAIRFGTAICRGRSRSLHGKISEKLAAAVWIRPVGRLPEHFTRLAAASNRAFGKIPSLLAGQVALVSSLEKLHSPGTWDGCDSVGLLEVESEGGKSGEFQAITG
jgi:hypothetical protein